MLFYHDNAADHSSAITTFSKICCRHSSDFLWFQRWRNGQGGKRFTLNHNVIAKTNIYTYFTEFGNVGIYVSTNCPHIPWFFFSPL